MRITTKWYSLKLVLPFFLCLMVMSQLRFLLDMDQDPSQDSKNENWNAPPLHRVGDDGIPKVVSPQDQVDRYYHPSSTNTSINPSNNNNYHHHHHHYNRKSRFAYAFLIAGCDFHKPSYRGFLYNVLVSTYVLQTEGSKADIVLFLRMKNTTIAPTLPREERWLRDSGIQFYYLPPPLEGESFYSAMMAKFYVLTLTDYDRVMYLDADVMPLCNLDYVFEMSMRGILQENLVMTWWGEPAIGAIFMLRPGIHEYQQLIDIVTKQRQQIQATQQQQHKRWPPFDEEIGWGHKIELPDEWYAFKHQHGTKWNFQFAFADQGLLYHWVKYVKNSVSIVFSRRVLNYSQTSNGTVILNETLSLPFENVTCPLFPWDVTAKKGMGPNTFPFYHDFKHFSGKHKPWEKNNVQTGIPSDVIDKTHATSPLQYWFHVLRIVNRQLNMSLDVEKISFGRPSLGRGPTFYHMAKYMQGSKNVSSG